eukprot:EG_transcript_40252
MAATAPAIQVVIGSTNPVKVNCVAKAFAKCFPEREVTCSAVVAESGVPAQPISDAETLQGARNRAAHARTQSPAATYWVGIEGGLEWQGELLLTMAWVVVLGPGGREGVSHSAGFVLPQALVELIRQGHELGAADDLLFARHNSKQQSGTVGRLTG